MDGLAGGGVAGRADVARRGGEDDVVEGQEVVTAQVLGCLGDVADRDWIGADLGLGEGPPRSAWLVPFAAVRLVRNSERFLDKLL